MEVKKNRLTITFNEVETSIFRSLIRKINSTKSGFDVSKVLSYEEIKLSKKIEKHVDEELV